MNIRLIILSLFILPLSTFAQRGTSIVGDSSTITIQLCDTQKISLNFWFTYSGDSNRVVLKDGSNSMQAINDPTDISLYQNVLNNYLIGTKKQTCGISTASLRGIYNRVTLRIFNLGLPPLAAVILPNTAVRIITDDPGIDTVRNHQRDSLQALEVSTRIKADMATQKLQVLVDSNLLSKYNIVYKNDTIKSYKDIPDAKLIDSISVRFSVKNPKTDTVKTVDANVIENALLMLMAKAKTPITKDQKDFFKEMEWVQAHCRIIDGNGDAIDFSDYYNYPRKVSDIEGWHIVPIIDSAAIKANLKTIADYNDTISQLLSQGYQFTGKDGKQVLKADLQKIMTADELKEIKIIAPQKDSDVSNPEDASKSAGVRPVTATSNATDTSVKSAGLSAADTLTRITKDDAIKKKLSEMLAAKLRVVSDSNWVLYYDSVHRRDTMLHGVRKNLEAIDSLTKAMVNLDSIHIIIKNGSTDTLKTKEVTVLEDSIILHWTKAKNDDIIKGLQELRIYADSLQAHFRFIGSSGDVLKPIVFFYGSAQDSSVYWLNPVYLPNPVIDSADIQAGWEIINAYNDTITSLLSEDYAFIGKNGIPIPKDTLMAFRGPDDIAPAIIMAPTSNADTGKPKKVADTAPVAAKGTVTKPCPGDCPPTVERKISMTDTIHKILSKMLGLKEAAVYAAEHYDIYVDGYKVNFTSGAGVDLITGMRLPRIVFDTLGGNSAIEVKVKHDISALLAILIVDINCPDIECPGNNYPDINKYNLNRYVEWLNATYKATNGYGEVKITTANMSDPDNFEGLKLLTRAAPININAINVGVIIAMLKSAKNLSESLTMAANHATASLINAGYGLIDSISIQYERGFIENIKVYVTQGFNHYMFENCYAIGASSKGNYRKYNYIWLWDAYDANQTSAARHICLADVFKYDYQLENYRRDFSPADTVINIYPVKQLQAYLFKESLANIFEARAFTDLDGFGRNNPNGLIQIEINRTFNLNTNRSQMTTRTDWGVLNYLHLQVNASKLENKDRDLILSNQRTVNNSEVVSPSYATNLDFQRYENFSVVAEPNILILDFPDSKTTFHADFGFRYGYTPVTDSILVVDTAAQAVKTPVNANKYDANTITVYPKMWFEVFSERVYGFTAGYQFNTTWLFSNNLFKQVVSYSNKAGDIQTNPLDKAARYSHEIELAVRVRPNPKDKNGNLFATARFFMQQHDINTFFPQILLGYSYNLVLKK